MPERSFFYRGKQLPVCARCTGVWLGYVLGLIFGFVFPLPWTTSVVVGVVLMIPAGIDGGTQLFGWRTSHNSLRLLTGIWMGVGEMLIIIPGLLLVSWLGYQFGNTLK